MLKVQTVSAAVDPYVLKTKGIITASKLKAFQNCPFGYKLVYDDMQPLARKVKKYFMLGTAFDDLVSYGEEEFLKKYLILAPGKNAVSQETLDAEVEKYNTLVFELSERQQKYDEKMSENEALRIAGKKEKATTQVTKSLESWKNKVQESHEKVFELENVLKYTQLTAADGDLIAKLQREAERQTFFDANGVYETQKRFTATFKGKLKLGGTLDRYKKGDVIRDMKLVDDIDKAEFKIQDNGYLFSMAFYQLLVELETGEKLPCILDFFDKKEVPRYRPMELPQHLLDQERNNIQANLLALLACYENDYFPNHAETNHIGCNCPAYEFCPGSIRKLETYS